MPGRTTFPQEDRVPTRATYGTPALLSRSPPPNMSSGPGCKAVDKRPVSPNRTLPSACHQANLVRATSDRSDRSWQMSRPTKSGPSNRYPRTGPCGSGPKISPVNANRPCRVALPHPGPPGTIQRRGHPDPGAIQIQGPSRSRFNLAACDALVKTSSEIPLSQPESAVMNRPALTAPTSPAERWQSG